MTVFRVLLLLGVLALPVVAEAQPWSTIIDPARATDWRRAGVVNAAGVAIDPPSASWPNCVTTPCNTLFSGGGNVTAANIESALSSAGSSCGQPCVVRIPAGTFSVAAFNHQVRNVVLRGAGSWQTRLNMTSAQSGSGHGGNDGAPVHLQSGATGTWAFRNLPGGAIFSTTWTGTGAGVGLYPQGSTVLTLGSTAGMVAGPVGSGSLLILDQCNDGLSGAGCTGTETDNGDLYICERAAGNCSSQGNNGFNRTDRAQVQLVTVTAINGNQVTISPPLAMPNWRASQSPGVWWVSLSGVPLGNAGIENLTIDHTGSGQTYGIFVGNCANCWVTGTRVIWTGTIAPNSGGSVAQYHVDASAHVTIRSNYAWGPQDAATDAFRVYAWSDSLTSDLLVENNIFHHNLTPIIPNDPSTGNVYAYNYVDDGYTFGSSFQYHSGPTLMALLEGNNVKVILGDVIHGVHHMNTHFRNHHDGTAHNRSATTDMSTTLETNNRLFNIIGNVFGHTSWSIYEESAQQGNIVPNDSRVIYLLGWQGNNSGGGTPVPDSNVRRTLFRWGNWDNVCPGGGTCIRFVTSENPCGAPCGNSNPNYPNIATPSQTLPASFYLAAKPSWWGPNQAWGVAEPPFPPIGPDVTGGPSDAVLGGGTRAGGHAYKIPARLCFENTIVDSAYGATSPQVRRFDAAACYFASGTPTPPAAPCCLTISTSFLLLPLTLPLLAWVIPRCRRG